MWVFAFRKLSLQIVVGFPNDSCSTYVVHSLSFGGVAFVSSLVCQTFSLLPACHYCRLKAPTGAEGVFPNVRLSRISAPLRSVDGSFGSVER